MLLMKNTTYDVVYANLYTDLQQLALTRVDSQQYFWLVFYKCKSTDLTTARKHLCVWISSNPDFRWKKNLDSALETQLKRFIQKKRYKDKIYTVIVLFGLLLLLLVIF
jgi:hypothetical protein